MRALKFYCVASLQISSGFYVGSGRAHQHKIANKRRPKKARAPYKHYVYGAGFVGHNSDDDSEPEQADENSPRGTKDVYGSIKDFKAQISVDSVYILSGKESYKGSIWPLSKFEKVDVLDCAINGRNRNYLVKPPPPPPSMLHLPVEILVYIFEVVNLTGHLRPKHLRVSKLIYSIVLPMIYKNPRLRATNFFAFVDALGSNKKLGTHVYQLDLSYVIQSGKNAFVSKLLRWSRDNLTYFIAPQTSFGLTPLFSLRKCTQLKVLDLSFVSETVKLEDLFESISNLSELNALSFPRSSVSIENYDKIEWPKKLTYLRLSGGISDEFLSKISIPETIEFLEFAHCPAISDYGFKTILHRVGYNLKSLKVQYPMPRLSGNALDIVWRLCPSISILEVTVDYMSDAFFDEENLKLLHPERKLKTLYIDSSGMMGTATKIDPVDLALAMNEHRLPNLKNLRCTVKLGWGARSEYVSFIANELDERGGGLYTGY